MAIRINGIDYTSTTNSRTGDEVHKALGASEVTGLHVNENARGTYHIANNPNMYEIQRNNNFEFVVFFGEDLLEAGLVINGSGASAQTEDMGKFSGAYAQEVIRMSVSKTFVPHFSQSPIAVKRGNSTLKYAGVPEFKDGSLTLNDYIGADTKAILMAWQNLSYNVATEKVGLASDYKKTAHIIEYSPDLQPIRTWTLYGCWITGLSEDDYSSDSGDKHNITVDLSYDKAVLDSNEALV